MSITPTLRKLIFTRDNETCVACGTSQSLTIHHRINRGAGGSKLFDKPAFLLTICITCNGLFESDSNVAAKARELGYKLHRNHRPTPDPTAIPVFYKSEGDWYLLDHQGTKRSSNGK